MPARLVSSVPLDPEDDLTPNQRVQAGFDLTQPPEVDLLHPKFSSAQPFLGQEEGAAFEPHPDIKDWRGLSVPMQNLQTALEKKATASTPRRITEGFDPYEQGGPLAREMQAQVPEATPGAPRILERLKEQLPIYQTELSPKEEAAYFKWAKGHGIPDTKEEESDYDLRGFYKSGGQFGPNNHAPDTFKKPNHPTFSDESKYHGVGAEFGGSWSQNPDKTWTFRAGPSNIHYWGPENLKTYFSKFEPGNKLLLPGDEGYDQPRKKK